MHHGKLYLVLSLMPTWTADPQTHIRSPQLCYLRSQQRCCFISAVLPASEKILFPKILQPNSSKWIFPFSPAGTAREHLGLAMALKVPIFIVISKVDLCTRATVDRTVKQLERLLKQPGCNKVPMVISSKDDAVAAVQQFVQSPK